MTTATALNARNRSSVRYGRLIVTSLVAMGASAAANIGLYLTAGAFFPEVTAWPGAGIGQIMAAGNGYLTVAAIVFALVARFSTRPARHYVIVAAAGLLFSFAMPLMAAFGADPSGAPAAGLATVITLSLMHVIAFAISVPLFVRYALK